MIHSKKGKVMQVYVVKSKHQQNKIWRIKNNDHKNHMEMNTKSLKLNHVGIKKK